MIATLVKPSLLIHQICFEKFGNLNLFKFSDRLQNRMEPLSIEEVPDLETIGELDRIFTYINAMLAAQNVNSCKL